MINYNEMYNAINSIVDKEIVEMPISYDNVARDKELITAQNEGSRWAMLSVKFTGSQVKNIGTPKLYRTVAMCFLTLFEKRNVGVSSMLELASTIVDKLLLFRGSCSVGQPDVNVGNVDNLWIPINIVIPFTFDNFG